MCHDARVDLLSTMWIFFPPCGAWELSSQVTRFDKRRSLLTEPFHWPLVSFFWDKVSLPSLDWPQIYYIAQTSVKLFKFLKFYLVYIYLRACLHTCLSVYAHWCTLVHAYCLCVGQRSEFSSSTKLVLEVYQAWQQVPLPTSLLIVNIDRCISHHTCTFPILF